MAKELTVWLFDQHVGTLAQIDGRLDFTYAPEWLANTDATPLSQSLPLQPERFDDRTTRPFFAGLLPEGSKRKLIAQALQVSRQNDFALLDGIGGECAGAVTLLEPGQTPQASDTPEAVRWLAPADLLAVLDDMPRRPMLAGEQDMRLSLAGAQDKLPVVVRGEPDRLEIGLPRFGTPSTHILKPAIAGIEGSVFNEGFCLALARALKLDVAQAAIHQVQQDSQQRDFLLVQRYDRQHMPAGLSTDQLVRLHQEDFCQALGLPPETKYQNEGGPNLADAFALLRRATRPSAPHTLKLLDFVIFNALVGNHDAHSKNFSLLYTPQGAVLAPLYDVLCTAVYPRLTDKMAMKIGSKYKFSEVQARHWAQFAVEAGLSPALVKKRILDIAKRLPALAHATQAAFEAQDSGHPILSQIVMLIEQRCALTTRRLTTPEADDPESPFSEDAP